MPEERNNRIDQWLKDYARERRRNPEPRPDGPARRALQDEVARVHGEEDRAAPAGNWFRRFWPFVLFGSLCSIITIVAVLIFNERGEVTVASQNQKPAALTAGDAVILNESNSSQIAATAQPDLGIPAQGNQLPELAPAASAPQTAAAGQAAESLTMPPAGPAAARGYRAPRGSEATTLLYSRRLPNTAAPPPAAPTQSVPNAASPRLAAAAAGPEIAPIPVIEADELAELGAAFRTFFVQVTNAGSAAPVLPSFRVEQLGEAVRFVDRDGSVYRGRLLEMAQPFGFQPAESPEPSAAPQIETISAAPALTNGIAITNAAVYRFEVSGTNLTLGTSVHLQGRYVARTNDPSRPLRGIAGISAYPTAAAARRARLTPGPEFTKAAIVGTATIGGTNEVPFKALAPE